MNEKKQISRDDISSETMLAEIFSSYPKLWQDMGQIDEELSEPKDPMLSIMLSRATVGELAKSLSIDASDLTEKIREMIGGYIR